MTLINTTKGDIEFTNQAVALAQEHNIALEDIAEWHVSYIVDEDVLLDSYKIGVADIRDYIDILETQPQSDESDEQASEIVETVELELIDQSPLSKVISRAFPTIPSELHTRFVESLERYHVTTDKSQNKDVLTRRLIDVVMYDARMLASFAQAQGATLPHNNEHSLRGIDVSSLYAHMSQEFKSSLSRSLGRQGMSEARNMATRGASLKIHDAYREALNLTGEHFISSLED